jgi:hypothetical protein
MDEDDDTWLKAFNQDHSPKISEDQFEQVMWEFESLANENMPFLSVVSLTFSIVSIPASSYLFNVLTTENLITGSIPNTAVR